MHVLAAKVLQALLPTRESNRTRIVECIRTRILFLFAIIGRSPPNSVHQSVSVGHYLLHPNNREFNQGTAGSGQSTAQSTSSDPWPFDTHNVQPIHQCRDLRELFLLISDLPKDSTVTKTVSRCESEPWIFTKLFLQTAPLQFITETPLSGHAKRVAMSWNMLALCVWYNVLFIGTWFLLTVYVKHNDFVLQWVVHLP